MGRLLYPGEMKNKGYAEFKRGGGGGGRQGALWEKGKGRILFAKRMNEGREKGHLFWTG